MKGRLVESNTKTYLPSSHIEIVESVESEAVNSFSFFRLETLEELLIAGGVHGMTTTGDVRSTVWKYFL